MLNLPKRFSKLTNERNPMTSELLPCPFCNEKPCIIDDYGKECWCKNESCLMFENGIQIEAWNTRPVQSGLDEEAVEKIIKEWNYSFNTTDTEKALRNLIKSIITAYESGGLFNK